MSDELLAAFTIFGFGYCVAVVAGFLRPKVKSALWSFRVRREGRKHADGPWKVKFEEEKAKAQTEELLKFAGIITESSNLEMWYFKLGAIYWSHYQESWVAKLSRDEFTTWDQALHDWDREGWNNILEMNRMHVAMNFRAMSKDFSKNQKEAREFIKTCLLDLDQVKRITK